MNYEKLSKSKKKKTVIQIFNQKIVKIFFYTFYHVIISQTIPPHTLKLQNFSYLCASNINWNEYVRRNKRYIRLVV